VVATQEQLREGFDRWLRDNPKGLMERGRNHSQTHWPKEWEDAGYRWFSPPVCLLCGKNMVRASHRAFPLDDGSETTIITFNCKNAHKQPEQAFRSVAGEIAKPIGGGRGRGGVYEIKRGGKVLRTRPLSSAAAVVAYQKKKRAAREAAEHQERVQRYGPDAAENWDSLTHADKISLAWNSRTPEGRKEWASNIRQAQMQPERQALRSKVSKQMWATRRAKEEAADRRVIELREQLREAELQRERLKHEALDQDAKLALEVDEIMPQFKAWFTLSRKPQTLWPKIAAVSFVAASGSYDYEYVKRAYNRHHRSS
jgi:hypothetical protein